MAREINLRAIAFADHNTVASVEEGQHLSQEWGIEFLPCLELNTFHRGLDLHLLAFFIDPQDPRLQRWLDEIHAKKEEQARRRLEKLNELGFLFNWEDLNRFAGGRIPTGSSFLRAILSREENRGDPRLEPYIRGHRSRSPYVNFYRDFLRGGKPGFVPMEDLAALEAISKIHGLGGVPILAHPSDTGEAALRELIASGLSGLEVYSPYHNAEEQQAFRAFAEEHGLLMTAGSDFHGREVKPDVELGQVFGDHEDLLQALKKYHERKQ